MKYANLRCKIIIVLGAVAGTMIVAPVGLAAYGLFKACQSQAEPKQEALKQNGFVPCNK